jgi:hypothetical protein
VAKSKTRSFSDPIDEIRNIYEYLNLQEGQEEIFTILDLIKNVDFRPHPKQEELRVMHCA